MDENNKPDAASDEADSSESSQSASATETKPQSGGEGAKKPEKNLLMGILAYLGPLVIVSYLVAKDDPFVKFHIKQGLVLFVIEVAMWFLGGMMLYQLWMLMNLVNLGVLVLSVLGIVNVVQGKQQELPLIGQFGKHFPI